MQGPHSDEHEKGSHPHGEHSDNLPEGHESFGDQPPPFVQMSPPRIDDGPNVAVLIPLTGGDGKRENAFFTKSATEEYRQAMKAHHDEDNGSYFVFDWDTLNTRIPVVQTKVGDALVFPTRQLHNACAVWCETFVDGIVKTDLPTALFVHIEWRIASSLGSYVVDPTKHPDADTSTCRVCPENQLASYAALSNPHLRCGVAMQKKQWRSLQEHLRYPAAFAEKCHRLATGGLHFGFMFGQWTNARQTKFQTQDFDSRTFDYSNLLHVGFANEDGSEYRPIQNLSTSKSSYHVMKAAVKNMQKIEGFEMLPMQSLDDVAKRMVQ